MDAGRRRGGQPGNLNALKHGFYSKQFQEGEIRDLEEAEGLKEEIGMMRLMTRRLFGLARGCKDMDEMISVLGALGTASMRLRSSTSNFFVSDAAVEALGEIGDPEHLRELFAQSSNERESHRYWQSMQRKIKQLLRENPDQKLFLLYNRLEAMLDPYRDPCTPSPGETAKNAALLTTFLFLVGGFGYVGDLLRKTLTDRYTEEILGTYVSAIPQFWLLLILIFLAGLLTMVGALLIDPLKRNLPTMLEKLKPGK